MNSNIGFISLLITTLISPGCFDLHNSDSMDSAYKPLTVQEIDTTSDDDLVYTVFGNIFQKISASPDEKYQAVIKLPKPQQAIYIIWMLLLEVNNGGFNQYYYNSEGQFASMLPDALELIDAHRFADLVKQANTVYKENYKNITDKQDGTIEGFSKSYENNPLNKFDDAFYEMDIEVNLEQLQVDFIRKHKQAFAEQ